MNKKDETKKDELIDALENAENNRPVKSTVIDKEAKSAFYRALAARLNTVFAGFWFHFLAGIGAGEKASRVSVYFAGCKGNVGRIAKIENGAFVFVFAALPDNKRPDYTVSYTPTLENALETYILNSVRKSPELKALFIETYQKASVYMTPEQRANLKKALSTVKGE